MTAPQRRRRRRSAPLDVVFVCTANQCRSPIAAALLRARLTEARFLAVVTSTGLLAPGEPVPPTGLRVMMERSIDLSDHRSTQLSSDVVHHADLLLGMATRHVREVVSAYPHAWPKAFLLKDFVRRAQDSAPRDRREGFDDWLARVGQGRQHSDLLSSSPHDDIQDPMGRSEKIWRSVLDDIDTTVERLAVILTSSVRID